LTRVPLETETIPALHLLQTVPLIHLVKPPIGGACRGFRLLGNTCPGQQTQQTSRPSTMSSAQLRNQWALWKPHLHTRNSLVSHPSFRRVLPGTSLRSALEVGLERQHLIFTRETPGLTKDTLSTHQYSWHSQHPFKTREPFEPALFHPYATLPFQHLLRLHPTGVKRTTLRVCSPAGAPRRRRGRRGGGAAATRQRSVAQQAPTGTPSEFVLHSLNEKGARPAYETCPTACGLQARRLPLDVQ
jgi:hypothetical protein